MRKKEDRNHTSAPFNAYLYNRQLNGDNNSLTQFIIIEFGLFVQVLQMATQDAQLSLPGTLQF
jgi:hypothetical protein